MCSLLKSGVPSWALELDYLGLWVVCSTTLYQAIYHA